MFFYSDHYFNGRYCLLDFQVPDAVWNVECANNDPLEVYLGICLPAACTLGETRELVQCDFLLRGNYTCLWTKAF